MGKKCDCLFCQMTCPKCGEWEGIRVRMDIHMDLIIDNQTYGFIRIEKDVYSDDIEVDCESCGYTFSDEECEKLRLEIYRHANVDDPCRFRCDQEKAA